eukprot:5959854-Alexandrium_andersonii.AAC.1
MHLHAYALGRRFGVGEGDSLMALFFGGGGGGAFATAATFGGGPRGGLGATDLEAGFAAGFADSGSIFGGALPTRAGAAGAAGAVLGSAVPNLPNRH